NSCEIWVIGTSGGTYSFDGTRRTLGFVGKFGCWLSVSGAEGYRFNSCRAYFLPPSPILLDCHQPLALQGISRFPCSASNVSRQFSVEAQISTTVGCPESEAASPAVSAVLGAVCRGRRDRTRSGRRMAVGRAT